MVFSGPLDAVELTVNVPFLNFKSFVGFSGVLGVFSPFFNPYSITAYDRSFVEQTNLLNPTVLIQFNATQSRRIFFATDFDINIFAQHINPYFLMQYDISQIFGNTSYTVSTFHLGINFEGRIIENFYYKLNLSGMFGTNQKVSTNTILPIVACGFTNQLRYTLKKALNSTFILNHALGTGNNSTTGFWDDSNGTTQSSVNKYYYYGKFDGGFVLNPILSNIQSLSFKYSLSPPFKTENFSLTIYFAFYQTFKIWSAGTISDTDATLDSYVVGSELDSGMLLNFGKNTSFGIDFGVYLPETSYTVILPKMKAGLTLCVNL